MSLKLLQLPRIALNVSRKAAIRFISVRSTRQQEAQLKKPRASVAVADDSKDLRAVSLLKQSLRKRDSKLAARLYQKLPDADSLHLDTVVSLYELWLEDMLQSQTHRMTDIDAVTSLLVDRIVPFYLQNPFFVSSDGSFDPSLVASLLHIYSRCSAFSSDADRWQYSVAVWKAFVQIVGRKSSKDGAIVMNEFLSLFIQCNPSSTPEDVLFLIEKCISTLSITPDARSTVLWIKSASETTPEAFIDSVFHFVSKHSIPLDITICNALLQLCAKTHSLEALKPLLSRCLASPSFKPTHNTMNAIMAFYLKHRQMHSVIAVFKAMTGRDASADLQYLPSSPSDDAMLSRLRFSCTPNIVTYNILMQMYSLNLEPSKAHQVLQTIAITPSTVSINIVMEAYRKCNMLDKVVEVFNEYMCDGTVKPSLNTAEILRKCEAVAADGQIRDALGIALRQCQTPRLL